MHDQDNKMYLYDVNINIKYVLILMQYTSIAIEQVSKIFP